MFNFLYWKFCESVRRHSGCVLPSRLSVLAVPVESRMTVSMPQLVIGRPHGALTFPPAALQATAPVIVVTGTPFTTHPASVDCHKFLITPSLRLLPWPTHTT